MQARLILKYALYLLFAGIVISYAIFRFVDYRAGSTIAISYPQNGSTLHSSFVSVKGSADRISYISFNGLEINTDKAGNFIQNILLHPGYNALSVQVADRFGRIKTKTVQVVYDPVATPTENGFALKKEGASDLRSPLDSRSGV